MSPSKEPCGKWYVSHGGKRIAGPFDTNAQAWRWIDRDAGYPVSRSENVSDWIFQKTVEEAF